MCCLRNNDRNGGGPYMFNTSTFFLKLLLLFAWVTLQMWELGLWKPDCYYSV